MLENVVPQICRRQSAKKTGTVTKAGLMKSVKIEVQQKQAKKAVKGKKRQHGAMQAIFEQQLKLKLDLPPRRS